MTVLNGKVIGECHSRHRHQEWLKFLRRLDGEFPPALQLHLVMDNYGTGWPRARAMESFFGTLKTECLHHFKFQTRDQARQVVFEYIEVFYNRIRRHATIQNQVPANYAQQFYKDELQIAA